MTATEARPAGSATLQAAGLVAVYASLIGFTDNFVRVIAADIGLWQFHAMRSLMALPMLALAAPFFGVSLRPKRWGGVLARSLVHGTAMVFYFGCLAFLPVAVVAAGLFTAPIFVLLLSRFAFGHRIGPVRIVAVAIGFLGVLMVLGPATGGAVPGPVAALPVLAGALYALGNLATREWCEGETAGTLLAGFFAALGVFGLLGVAIIAVLEPTLPSGPAAFALRGVAAPGAAALFWVFMQALLSLIGVGLMIRAYQIAEASRVAVFEYAILPASALWGWIIWGEVLGPVALAGMALIAAAGAVIALRR
ncbi:MAG: DMT family transporter [Paracoccaceae bacterium]